MTSMRFIRNSYKIGLLFSDKSCYTTGLNTESQKKAMVFIIGVFPAPLFNYLYYSIFDELKQAKNPLFIRVYDTFSTTFFKL